MPDKAVCRKFKAIKDLEGVFDKGTLFTETFPKSEVIRDDDAAPGFIGISLGVFDKNSRLEKYLEHLEPVVFEDTGNFKTMQDSVLKEVPLFESIVNERIVLLKGTPLESALQLIARGIKCLKGEHELVWCQLGHESVNACKHCAWIDPASRYCTHLHTSKVDTVGLDCGDELEVG